MERAREGHTVRVHYTGSLSDGSVFDSSRGREPLEFTVGSGQVIPGFDRAVEGLAVGESRQVRLDPEEAYGPAREDLVVAVPRGQFPPDGTPEVGMQVQVQGQELTVEAMQGRKITRVRIRTTAPADQALGRTGGGDVPARR